MESSNAILLSEGGDNDDEKEDKKDDDEGKTCSGTHKCNNQSITGHCILKDGHEEAHFCGWCASSF